MASLDSPLANLDVIISLLDQVGADAFSLRNAIVRSVMSYQDSASFLAPNKLFAESEERCKRLLSCSSALSKVNKEITAVHRKSDSLQMEINKVSCEEEISNARLRLGRVGRAWFRLK